MRLVYEAERFSSGEEKKGKWKGVQRDMAGPAMRKETDSRREEDIAVAKTCCLSKSKKEV